MLPRLPALLAIASTLALALAASSAFGQDDALKKLLEKLDPQAPSSRADEKKAETPKPEAGRNEQKKNEQVARPAAAPKPNSNDQVNDKALDSLLEKLGGGRSEAPKARGNAPGELAPKPDQTEANPDTAKVDSSDMDLDEHLERLLGRIKKNKNEQDQEGENQQQEGGRLSETVKKMREVEQRLTKLDTGGETRKTQGEIVGELDQLLKRIQQFRQQQQRQQGQRQQPGTPGQQQGQQPGQEPGENAGGAPPMQPKPPEPATGLAGAKDTWGHLPGSLREVMENVSRMQPLPEKKDLVERYFLSVAKRSLSRSGGE